MSAIDAKHLWLLQNGLNLGEPIGAETHSTDMVGWVRPYQYGTIYWHPRVDAFEVHGAIRDRYFEWGGERGTLGYPTTDESGLPDGAGRFNDFEFGRITWWSATNTVEVTEFTQSGLSRVEAYIAAVEAAESAYSADTPEQFLTRLRQMYYPDPVKESLGDALGMVERFKFATLIPDAPVFDSYLTLRRLDRAHVGESVFMTLTERADENGVQDNPSPYVVDNLRWQSDIGHAMLTLDALVHPRPAPPYSHYGIPSIDPANFVADLGLAGFWTTTHQRDGHPSDAPVTLSLADFNGYYHMSAPDSDLIGDADGFGFFAIWQGNPGIKLSQVLRRYYLADGGNSPGYWSRWRTFCSANQLAHSFDLDTNTIEWDVGIGDQWIRRISRICDLLEDNWISAGLIFYPEHEFQVPVRSWPLAGTAFSTFRDWLSAQLVAEYLRT